jgi:hypothetical protein
MWKSFVSELHGEWSEFAAGYNHSDQPRQPDGANELAIRISSNQTAPDGSQSIRNSQGSRLKTQ